MSLQIMPTKVSDQIVDYLMAAGFKRAFGVSGGAIMHLMHSLAPKLETVFTHHEQAAIMAAEASNRADQKVSSLVFATSGPGATNLVTGLAGAFYDSVPVLAITGQASTFRQVGTTGVRQVGFQETPISRIVEPITKYSATIKNIDEIPEVFFEALNAMNSHRKGPVLVDIPDDILRSRCHSLDFREFKPAPSPTATDSDIQFILDSLRNSKRPVLILGAGLNGSSGRNLVSSAIRKLGIPTLLTWGAADLLPRDHEQRVGLFGTHGQRAANIVVQNSDLIIAFGTKLDTKSTGTPVSAFAPMARKIIVDIDQTEFGKFAYFDLKIDLGIQADALLTLTSLANAAEASNQITQWKSSVRSVIEILAREDVYVPENSNFVSPVNFFSSLSDFATHVTDFVLDTGNSLGWFLNEYRLLPDQRVWHDFNNTAMGWSLPASLGIAKLSDRNVFTIIGDGSIMMSLSELATLKHHSPGATVVLLNNSGYGMIRQTQNQWLDSSHIGSNTESLFFPNFQSLATGFGYEYTSISSDSEIHSKLASAFGNTNAPKFIEVHINPKFNLLPQVKFGNALEVMDPQLKPELESQLDSLMS